jgi:hypothetical protein
MKQRIVVIEDERSHIDDARAYFATIPNLQVDYATNKYDSTWLIWDENRIIPGEKILYAQRADLSGVISDIFFPSQEDSSLKAPLGIVMAYELDRAGVPFVLNTSKYHHAAEIGWMVGLCRKENWFMIDSGTSKGEGEHKDWEKAHKTLQERIKNR